MGDSYRICNKLSVEQGLEKGLLGGPFQSKLTLKNGVSVSINQFGKRTIELSTHTPTSWDDLFTTFQRIEKLLMLLDGRFYPIEKLRFFMDGDELTDVSIEYEQKRLGYFSSKDFCRYSWLRLMPFQNVLTDELIGKWNVLLDELDIAFQSLLYSLSDNRMPVDLNFAFLVELAEPFTELLKEQTCYCQSLTPGERGTTLKMCVDTLIVIFGKAIFGEELSGDYASFLNLVVGSRVRIMHIKKKQNKFFDGKDCVKYSMKFSLLYRKILFELLGINSGEYDEALQKATKIINKWE